MPSARPRRLTRHAVAALAAGAAGLVALGGCGGETDIDRATFRAELQERTQRPEAVVECLTERIYDEFEQGDVNRIYRAASEAEFTDTEREQLRVINEECLAEDPTAPTAPVTTEGG